MANTKVPVELFDAGAGFTIGSGAAEDTKIVFDGNAQDFYIGLDDSADDLVIGTGSTVGTNPKVVIENGGNVGIGTTSPDAILETSSSATGNTVGALLTNTNQSGTADSVSLNFGLGRTADSFIFSVPAIKLEKEQQFTSDGNTVDAALVFSTITNESTVQRMKISAGGRYGFNSTYPPTSAQFMRIEEELSTNRVMRISNRDNSAGGTTMEIGHADNNEGASIITAYHGNNVSGASGDPFLDAVFDLQVNGNISIDGTLSQGSDRRLKKDIANSTYGLAAINQLIPRTYKHRDVSKEMVGTQIGFIADEVESVIPEVVSKFGLKADGSTLPKTITGYGDEAGTEETFDNVKTLNYERLVVVLTKALQEADDKIEALTARMTTLEGS